MFTKRKDQSDINCLLPGSYIFDVLTFGAFSSCFLFGGGSSSKASQSTTNKDNSSVGEDEFLNVSDGSAGARDEGVSINASGKKSRTTVELSQDDNAGRVDVGDSNQINIQSVDGEITGQAFDFADEANYRSSLVSETALDDAFGFGTSTVQEAFDGLRDVSGEAFDTVEETAYQALQSNSGVTSEAFDFADEVNYRGFQFGESALDEVGESSRTIADALNDALGFAQTSQQSANDLSRVTNETLAMKSSDADSAVSSTLQRNILVGLAMLGLVVAFKD